MLVPMGELLQDALKRRYALGAFDICNVVEMMGSEQQVYLSVGHKSFVAKMDAATHLRMGDSVRLAFPKELIQLFDRETETNLVQQLPVAAA
ncbi:MAG: TOBE domain-containing protein [Chloroflexota bacterium]